MEPTLRSQNSTTSEFCCSSLKLVGALAAGLTLSTVIVTPRCSPTSPSAGGSRVARRGAGRPRRRRRRRCCTSARPAACRPGGGPSWPGPAGRRPRQHPVPAAAADAPHRDPRPPAPPGRRAGGRLPEHEHPRPPAERPRPVADRRRARPGAAGPADARRCRRPATCRPTSRTSRPASNSPRRALTNPRLQLLEKLAGRRPAPAGGVRPRPVREGPARREVGRVAGRHRSRGRPLADGVFDLLKPGRERTAGGGRPRHRRPGERQPAEPRRPGPRVRPAAGPAARLRRRQLVVRPGPDPRGDRPGDAVRGRHGQRPGPLPGPRVQGRQGRADAEAQRPGGRPQGGGPEGGGRPAGGAVVRPAAEGRPGRQAGADHHRPRRCPARRRHRRARRSRSGWSTAR